MKNEIQIFNNVEFGEVRTINKSGEPWFVGKDIAQALGYSNTRDAVSKHIDEEDKADVAIHDGSQNRNMTVINESGLYTLVLSSKLPTAKRFKKWVVGEVLPSIRKHGMYAADDLLDNPDIFIQTLESLKQERAARIGAERMVEYKNEVINGLVDDMDLLTKRNVLNRVVKHQGANFRKRWSQLYQEYQGKYGIDLEARCEGYNKKQLLNKNRLSTVKYAEKYGHMDKLYKVAVRLYESDIKKILDDLKMEVNR